MVSPLWHDWQGYVLLHHTRSCRCPYSHVKALSPSISLGVQGAAAAGADDAARAAKREQKKAARAAAKAKQEAELLGMPQQQ